MPLIVFKLVHTQLFLPMPETCRSTIVPLVTKSCECALAAEDYTLPVVVRQLGKLCHGLQKYFTTGELQHDRPVNSIEQVEQSSDNRCVLWRTAHVLVFESSYS